MRCPFRLVLTFSRKIPLLFVHSAVCRVVALSTSKHRSIRVKDKNAALAQAGMENII